MESLTKPDQQTQKDKHTIIILRIKGEGPDLIMSDGGETVADKSAMIKWEVADGSGVAEIVEIKKKDKPTGDVFKEKPSKETDKKWKGKIKDHFSEDTTEEYYIKYRKTLKGEVFTYDPKISVNA
jgi:hypothetical protein